MIISENIKQKAIERAKIQGWLANSPGESTNEGIVLCAAACLAYAGIQENEGMHSAENFLARIADKNDKEDVRNIFSKYGWNMDICETAMIDNDALPTNARLIWFQSHLQSLTR